MLRVSHCSNTSLSAAAASVHSHSQQTPSVTSVSFRTTAGDSELKIKLHVVFPTSLKRVRGNFLQLKTFCLVCICVYVHNYISFERISVEDLMASQ